MVSWGLGWQNFRVKKKSKTEEKNLKLVFLKKGNPVFLSIFLSSHTPPCSVVNSVGWCVLHCTVRCKYQSFSSAVCMKWPSHSHTLCLQTAGVLMHSTWVVQYKSQSQSLPPNSHNRRGGGGTQFTVDQKKINNSKSRNKKTVNCIQRWIYNKTVQMLAKEGCEESQTVLSAAACAGRFCQIWCHYA